MNQEGFAMHDIKSSIALYTVRSPNSSFTGLRVETIGWTDTRDVATIRFWKGNVEKWPSLYKRLHVSDFLIQNVNQ